MSAPGAATLSAHCRDALHAGIIRFDHGQFWHAHEDWEKGWRVEAGHDRDFLKGLIQVAAALHHAMAGRRRVAIELLRRAHGHLERHTTPRWGFRRDLLLRACTDLGQALAHRAPPQVPRLGALQLAHEPHGTVTKP